MPLSEITIPHHAALDFGLGVDRLSGMAMNLAVNPTQAETADADGASQSFEVSRVSTTHDLQESLGIDVNASYGCSAFGAGASARFSFSQSSEVHSASLFMSIVRTVRLADRSISHPVLSKEAADVADRQDVFSQRYGNMFARACKRGGLFVGLLHVETYSESDATKIEADLQGSYGMFSASASTNFSKAVADSKASVYCKVYSEGGPPVILKDPNDPSQLLNAANDWAQQMIANSKANAVPYQWTLAPLTIAEGPMPLNTVDVQHAQDVLQLCAQERAGLLDQLNLLNWWSRHPEHYDWSKSAKPEEIAAASAKTQTDLDTIAACASSAINNPADALMPTDYATKQGKKYPSALPVPTGPKPLPGATAPPPPPPPPVIPGRPQIFFPSQTVRRIDMIRAIHR